MESEIQHKLCICENEASKIVFKLNQIDVMMKRGEFISAYEKMEGVQKNAIRLLNSLKGLSVENKENVPD